jgi:hypothetical protein
METTPTPTTQPWACSLIFLSEIMCSSKKKHVLSFRLSHSQTHQSTLHYLLYIRNINHFEPLQPTITGEVETPVAVASVEFIDPREPVLVSLFHNIGYCT